MGYYGFLKVIKDNAMKVQLTDAYKQRLRQFFVDAMLYPAIDLELLNHGNGAATHKIVDAMLIELRDMINRDGVSIRREIIRLMNDEKEAAQ
jgi:hypothetical protein